MDERIMELWGVCASGFAGERVRVIAEVGRGGFSMIL